MPAVPQSSEAALAQQGRLSKIDVSLAREWLPELQGDEGRRQLREMADNDPVTGGIQNAIALTIRAADLTVSAGAEDRATELVTTAFDDLAVSFEDQIAEILDFLPMGFSPHEVCFKLRDGINSRYDDRLFGWHSFPQVPQETVADWEYDEYGQVKTLIQQNTQGGEDIPLPREKFLLFRTSIKRGWPEGRSIFRNAWTSFYIKRQLQVVQAIAAERQLAGFPVAKIPGAIIEQAQADIAAGRLTTPDAQIYLGYQALVADIRLDRSTGVVHPSDVDPDSRAPLFEVGFLSAPGGHNLDILPILEQLDARIAITCLADVILLGHQAVGTQALAQQKTSLFTTAIGTFLDLVLAEFNNRAIPQLLRINGMATDEPPQLIHGPLSPPSLAELGQFLVALKNAGFEFDTDPNGPLTDRVLESADLPTNPEGYAELVAQQSAEEQARQLEIAQARAQATPPVLVSGTGQPADNGRQPQPPAAGQLPPGPVKASEPPPATSPEAERLLARLDLGYGHEALVPSLE